MTIYGGNEQGQFAPKEQEKMVLIAVRLPQWMATALKQEEDRAEFIRQAIAKELNQ